MIADCKPQLPVSLSEVERDTLIIFTQRRKVTSNWQSEIGNRK